MSVCGIPLLISQSSIDSWYIHLLNSRCRTITLWKEGVSTFRDERGLHFTEQKPEINTLTSLEEMLSEILFFYGNKLFSRFRRIQFLKASDVPLPVEKTIIPITKTLLDLTVSQFWWFGIIVIFYSRVRVRWHQFFSVSVPPSAMSLMSRSRYQWYQWCRRQHWNRNQWHNQFNSWIGYKKKKEKKLEFDT